MNQIIVPYTKRKVLRDSFNTSYPTIRKALSGQSKSKLAKQIREKALHVNIGGYEIAPIENETTPK